ncbi:hypothetical protein G6016_10315 [Dietzia aerolata]|nr:hypothetical protein [Dietzia aerolata]
MRFIMAFVASAVLVLAGCASDEQGVESEPSSSETTTSSSASSSSATSSSEPTSPSDITSEPQPEAAPAAAPTSVEPYVVECLVGTPGPSRMSDGTIKSTDYCFYEMGGPQYLEQERQSGLGTAEQQPEHDGVPIADGGTCPAAICGYGHDENGDPNPSSGELQTQYGCEQGYITDVELCAAVGVPIG